MALAAATLVEAIRAITDPTAAAWTAFPGDQAEVARRWAAAFSAYAQGLAFPTLLPGAHDAALGAMVAVLEPPGTPPTQLGAGMAAYAAVLAAQVIPGLVATPPPGPAPIPVLPVTTNAAAAATAIASPVDAWMRTGLAGTVISGPVTPWS